MPHQQLDLIYARSQFTFFSQISDLRATIKQRKNEILPVFTQQDENEISRGLSYAIFDELKQKVVGISTESVRNSLNNRDISHLAFQNKILSMLLQHRIGLHFHLGTILLNLLSNTDDQLILFMPNNNSVITLEIDDRDNVTLIIKLVYAAMINNSQEPVIEACNKSATLFRNGRNDPLRTNQAS